MYVLNILLNAGSGKGESRPEGQKGWSVDITKEA